MKKLFLLSPISLVFALVMLVSCNNSAPKSDGAEDTGLDIEISELVDEINANCPKIQSESLEMVGAELTDAGVTINFNINDAYANIDAFNENKQIIKNSMKQTFAALDDESINLMFKLLEQEEKELKIVFTGMSSKKSTSIELSAEDISDLVNSDEEYNPHKLLEEQVQIINAQCPQNLEEGLTMTHATYENDNFVYYYDADEDLLSLEKIQQNYMTIKSNIIDELNSCIETERLIKTLKDADATLIYKYIGNTSKETCTIKIYHSEL